MKKFIIPFASRSRPEFFFRGVKSIENNWSGDNTYEIVGSFDIDDGAMYNPSIVERLNNTKNLRYYFGQSANKISAINREIPNFGYDWDVLINFSDDMTFEVKDFDKIIVEEFEGDLDKVLHFRDPNHKKKDALCTLSIMGKPYFDRDGYIYHPDFVSVWCDNLFQDMAIARGKYKFVDKIIYKHRHPAYHRDVFRDEQYERTEDRKVYAKDNATYKRLKRELLR